MTRATCTGWFLRQSLRLLPAAAGLAVLTLVAPALAAGRVHHVTLRMEEFRFQPPVLHLKAGEQVVLTLRNAGRVEHEWAVGRGVVNTQAEKGYHQDLLALLKPRVTGRDYELERASASLEATGSTEAENSRMISTEVDVEPGGVATLRFTVPAEAKGTWGMGCFVPGHYESGMKGTVVID